MALCDSYTVWHYVTTTLCNVIFLQNMEDLLLHPIVSQNDVIITGDVNIDWMKKSPAKEKLCEITAAFDLQQNINGSTHIGLSNESCIDLVFTRTDFKIIKHGIIFNPMHRGITWHNFTYIDINTTPKKSPRKIILKRNTRNFDAECYVREAYTTQFVTYSNSINVLTYELEQSINTLVNKHIPFKHIRVRPTRKPWLTHSLLKSISAKNRLFNQVIKTKDTNTWKAYKIIRNKILQQTRQAKKSYYTNIINMQAHSTNKRSTVWSVIKKLSHKKNASQDLKELVFNNTSYTKPVDVANVLNTFFSTIGPKINADMHKLAAPSFESCKFNINGFRFEQIDESIVSRMLLSLSNHKNGGMAQIPTYMYKLIAKFIVAPLTLIINQILDQNTFPDAWKEALVIPIPKSGDSANPSNHRPISLLPILSKVAEKVMYKQINEYLEKTHLISPHQYGFRQKHSTQSLLLQLTNRWLQILDNTVGDRYICLTALDIKKAFDTVDHNLLLSKLANHFNFHSSSIKLIHNYLSSRIQSVKINNVTSNSHLITTGIPQGSILGPLLFIMFINDITNSCLCYLFADDCIIEESGESPTSAIAKMNEKLPRVINWYTNNLLKINTDKTSVILLSNKTTDMTILNNVQINGRPVLFSNYIKYLGLHVDNHLNWNGHIRMTKNKIMPIVWNFSRVRHLINEETAKLYYTSLIRPLLEYAAATLYNMSGTNAQILEKIQNKCLRIITKAHSRTHRRVLRNLTHIPSLASRHTYLYLCEFYKLYKNISPKLLNDMLIVNTESMYDTRSAAHCNVKIPRMNKRVGQRSLNYLGPITFNSLPTNIKTSPSFSIFKKRLREKVLF